MRQLWKIMERKMNMDERIIEQIVNVEKMQTEMLKRTYRQYNKSSEIYSFMEKDYDKDPSYRC